MAAKSQENLIEQIGSLTLMEAAELVKALEVKFGVSAAAPAAVAAPAAAAAAAPAEAEVKAEYKVTLTDKGAKPIDVIKVVKTRTGLGLTEAKKAVDNAPTVLSESMPKDEAQKMKAEIEAAGGKVELA
ncbi:MAG: 50S ribosomal protein L7/L12 [Candidatus Babeliales bacterium]